MKPKDWILVAFLGAATYLLGLWIGSSAKWRELFLEGEGTSIRLVLDSIPIPQTDIGTLGAGSPQIHLTWNSVRSKAEFTSAIATSDGALARMEWIEDSDRKILPILRNPKILENLNPLFQRQKYRELHVIPLLWTFPAILLGENAKLPEVLKNGVKDQWLFEPILDFISITPTINDKSTSALGAWNQLASHKTKSQTLVTEGVARHALVLGLILFDTPATQSPAIQSWLEQLLDSQKATSAFLDTGFGITWQNDKNTIPEFQSPTSLKGFELKNLGD